MALTHETFAKATGGHKTVPEDWMPATGLRAIVQEDPCLLWLKFHGAEHGFKEDPKQYSFLEWIGNKGRAFEEAWIKNVCPGAVQALDKDVDVRRVEGLRRTLELMAQRVPVITKAALWWAPERIYGSSDVICLASWLYERFPHLKPDDGNQTDHYVVLDCKFSTRLDDSDKKTDLASNSSQVKIYSYILGHLQDQMPRMAYLVTRDRPFDPLPVSVNQRLHEPLDPHLTGLRDHFLHIKAEGGKYLPWRDEIVGPNWSNAKDEPWHQAKKQIAREYTPGGSLEWLPHVGSKQVAALKRLGISCLDDILKSDTPIPFQLINGLGDETAARIQAVVKANKTGKPSAVAAALVPAKHDVELFIDFEFLSNLNVDFERQWPTMEGCEMIFMVGVAEFAKGKWDFRTFIAAREDRAAERDMLNEFGEYLRKKGVFDRRHSAALYHWTRAEVTQSRQAAERHNLKWLDNLPWVDLQEPFHAGPISLPGTWGFGLKEIATSLPSNLRVEWPVGLGAGLAAMIVGFEAYQKPRPVESSEMSLLSSYLEVDCVATGQVLRWLRAVAVPGQQTQRREIREAFWYRPGHFAASDGGGF